MGVNWYGPDVMGKAQAAMEHGLDRLCAEIMKGAKRSMVEPKHGRDYRRGGSKQGGRSAEAMARDVPGGTWRGKGSTSRWRRRSSAPYEAPASQHDASGLMGSVKMERSAKLERKVGSDISGYPLYLEVGTSRMVERPWLRPALYKHTGRVGEEIFERLMR